ncbi:glycosyltransferase [Paraburkholderia caffeinilytica]|nr:glycosyltransferase [Paraburkholderia caffeinilytica]
MESASDEVIFPGAIYDKTVVEALRFFGRFYIHGHRVGGTNPSLVEALGAGSPVLAHDNHFNHWVAGEGAVFFKEEDDCSEQLDRLASDAEVLSELASGSINRFRTTFKWELILADYERLLEKWHP